jgi:hypothetical protein
MPQGSNGTSQESVDDIVLKLSRQDLIDSDLRLHYLHRLGEKWIEGGAREQVLRLLQSKESRLQSVAVHILANLAKEADLECLEDFVADPTISDMSKLSLAPILKSFDSEMAEDGLLEYLNDPAGAIRQMQAHLLELAGKNMLGIETILKDFYFVMTEERQLGFVNWLGNSGDPRAALILIPLLDLTFSPVVQPVIEALERLGPLAVSRSIPALQRFIAFSSNRKLKELARTVIQRLTAQALVEPDEFIRFDDQLEYMRYDARVSSLDGFGNQLIMLSWRRRGRVIHGINLLIHARYGLKDCYSIDDLNEAQWQGLIKDFQEHGYNSVSVPFDYARALAMEAYWQNKRTRAYLPLTYSLWRHHIEGSNSREKKKKLIASFVMVEPIPLSKLSSSDVLDSGDLFILPEFTSWLYYPMSEITPYINRYMGMFPQSFDITQFEQFPLNQEQRLALALRLEQLVEEATNNLITTEWRLTYEVLLRRQAAFFQQTERDQVAKRLRGLAAALHPDSPIPLEEQTFPQMLLRVSIRYGPIRLLLQTMRAESAKTKHPFYAH